MPTKEEVEVLLATPDTSTDKGLIVRAILELTYSTGLRRSEVCGLTIHDVDTAGGRVTVRNGKGAKDRVVPMGNQCCLWVRAYRDIVRPRLVSKSGNAGEQTFFLNERYGTPMSIGILGYLFRVCVKNSGIERRVTFHSLRHAFATHVLQGGADILDVREMLGHELVSTTQKYAALTIKDVKDAHRKFHPREQ